MKDWTRILVDIETPILDTIRLINEVAIQICLVVDGDRRLLGSVTDGDVRRGILAQVPLTAPVRQIMNPKPRTARAGTDPVLLRQRMAREQVHHMPLVDADNRVVDLVSIEDLVANTETHADNWVVLMAGGLGTRLRPLTDDLPKPLLAVGDRPVLATILENFIGHGFGRFFISVNYKADMIKDYFGDGSAWGVRIDYIDEPQALGTAGPLALLPETPPAAILVMNGDLLTQANFGQLVQYHRQQKSDATMCVRQYDVQVPFGVVEIENNVIASIDEKPVHRFFVNAGIYLLEPSVLDLIPRGQPYDMPELFSRLVAERLQAGVFPIHEYWLDIGRVDDLNRANREFQQVFGR